VFYNFDLLQDENGYGPVGTLIRQGPVPFFIRLVKPDTYGEIRLFKISCISFINFIFES